MLVLGGTGPMASEKRRNWIDWVHTALVQGNQVRDYVKWDDQPASLPDIVTSMLQGLPDHDDRAARARLSLL